MRAFSLLKKDRKAVSPVIGVILMVAATIVIAAIVMGYLGSFKPPSKPLDIELGNGILKVNSSKNWTATFTIAGSDAATLRNTSLSVTIFDNTKDTKVSVNKSNITIIGGSILQIKGYDTIDEGDQVHILIKYNPTGQILFDGILVARQD